jgi:hypothetical protein
MSSLDYCDAVTQTGKLCSRKAVCDSSEHSELYCKQHFVNYYDPSKGKFIVTKISRVAHDKTTGLPMRYVQGLTKKEKQLYKQEIDETNAYYKKTGLVKGREDVRVRVNFNSQKSPKSPKNKAILNRTATPYPRRQLGIASNMRRFNRSNVMLPKKRSGYAAEFEKRYGFKVTDLSKVKKLFPDTDVDTILAKGRAAYASGSRPSVTGKGGIEAWSAARLASSMTGGKAMVIDKNLIGPLSLKVIFSKKYNK